MSVITLELVKQNPDISRLISAANRMLEMIGYTEHGPRHVGYVSNTSAEILRKLSFPPRMVELSAIAGWLHDVGNAINRKDHGITGAAMLFPMLKEMGMPLEEVLIIVGAVGNHEEQTGRVTSAVSAALIIADKSDAHRTRVRSGKRYDPGDIHDRVNYAIKRNSVEVDAAERSIVFSLEMDPTSSVMEFLQIYLSRMLMSEEAAHFLGCKFDIVINGQTVNNPQLPGARQIP